MADSNITFKDITEANKTIKTTNIKGKEYAEVNQRIKAFRMLYPEGTISTDIISLDNGICVMKATVFGNDGIILGTGHAFEKESSSFINKTSYIENCETSAVGRALGMAGLGIDTSIASFEEVENAINNQSQPEPAKPQKKPSQASQPIICERCGNPVKAVGGNSASKIANAAKKQFGQILCMDCGHAVKVEREQAQKAQEAQMEFDEGMQLPFPIDE